MKILILAVHYEVTGARYIADAFTRLGHDVKHIGPTKRLEQAWGVAVSDKYLWEQDPNTGPFRPDLIIIADTEIMQYGPANYLIAGNRTPVIIWTQDNHVRNVRRAGIAHYFLAHYHGQAQPVSQPDETWLPCATDITKFTPSPIPWDEREYDVCMVGVMYPQRVTLLNRLRAEGFKVFAATGLVYDEYQKAYANSRISLCVSANRDVAQRVFETAGIGCLIVTDLLDDMLDPVTYPKLGFEGFLTYQSEQDLVDQVRNHLTVYKDSAQMGAERMQAIVIDKHKWDNRARVVVDWFEKEYGVADITVPAEQVQKVTGDIKVEVKTIDVGEPKFIPAGWYDKREEGKSYLNLGCGKTHFPSAKPAGHDLIPDDLYTYPLWLNVDKVEGVGADKTFDLFAYPWPLEDNSYDGAVLAHLVEHIPHEIKLRQEYSVGDYPFFNSSREEREKELLALQDGWYAFFSELYRVLTPDAIAHIVSPYGWSDGGITDPSHTRYLTMNTFTHSMTPEISDGSTFKYNNGGINFRIEGSPQYRVTPLFQHLSGDNEALARALQTQINVCYDFYVKLKAVK